MTTIDTVPSGPPAFPNLPDREWPIAAGFWEGAQQGELRLPTCTNCGTRSWYPTPRCATCFTKTLEWLPLNPVGRVDSFTVVRREFLSGFGPNLPHVVLRVRFDDAPEVVLISVLADRSQQDLVKIDARVEMEFPEVAPGFKAPLARIVTS